MALTLSLGNRPWYTQVGICVLLSMLGGVVFWRFYVQGVQESISDRTALLTSMRADIAKSQAKARQLPAFRREMAEQEAALARRRLQLPEEKDVADLLRRIQGMATQSNLKIRGFTPHAVTTRQLHAEWPIGLQLDGTYHSLGAFLDRVSKFPRIINVESIKIKGKDTDKTGRDRSTITAECTATTFVLLDAKPAPAVGTKAGGMTPGVPQMAARTE